MSVKINAKERGAVLLLKSAIRIRAFVKKSAEIKTVYVLIKSVSEKRASAKMLALDNAPPRIK